MSQGLSIYCSLNSLNSNLFTSASASALKDYQLTEITFTNVIQYESKVCKRILREVLKEISQKACVCLYVCIFDEEGHERSLSMLAK